MNQIRYVYKWEAELNDSTIISDGRIGDPDQVIRISFTSDIPSYPRHDIIFGDVKFVKRFTRSFMTMEKGLKEYLHCVITSSFRLYIFSSTGRCLITPVDYDLYI